MVGRNIIISNIDLPQTVENKLAERKTLFDFFYVFISFLKPFFSFFWYSFSPLQNSNKNFREVSDGKFFLSM